MATTKIWCDTTTGTWGFVDDKNGSLRIVEVRDEDASFVSDWLDQQSSGDVVDYFLKLGRIAQ